MLQNAFLNMGINAFHAMPDGGKLELGLGARRLEATDCDQLKPPVFPGDYFDVSIRDTGCGMSAEVAKRIFEPFFTTKESGKGTGLGMSMVHDTLKELGGSISVDSRLGEGTTFHVYLPRTASPPS
jgi:signal transduction histidine kinase